MALMINLNSKIINPPATPTRLWAEYENICAAEAEAEVDFWRQKRLAAQIVSMMGIEAYMAAVELAELIEGREDELFNRYGGA